MRDELLRPLNIDRNDGFEEVAEGHSVIPLGEVEVDSIVDFLDIDGVLVRAMLQNQLLEVQESPLVWNLLSHLDASPPCVVCITLCAIRALLVVLCVFNLEALLHNGTLIQFALHCDLDLDPPAMRLSPDEACVDDPQLV